MSVFDSVDISTFPFHTSFIDRELYEDLFGYGNLNLREVGGKIAVKVLDRSISLEQFVGRYGVNVQVSIVRKLRNMAINMKEIHITESNTCKDILGLNTTQEFVEYNGKIYTPCTDDIRVDNTLNYFTKMIGRNCVIKNINFGE